MNQVLKIGIMPREEFQKRTMDIASGRIKLNKDDPKIWFSSMKSLNEALSADNVRLFKITKHDQLMTLAGYFDNDTAEDMLSSIKQSRRNKNRDFNE